MATDNLALITPAQGDPSVRNNWAAAVVNPNMVTIDTAISGGLSKDVSAGGTIILTQDEAVNSSLVLTGSLAANATILYPETAAFNFSAQNNTTGSFLVSIGANNGSGAPAGTTVNVPQDGTTQTYRSDGTNVFARGGASIPIPLPISSGGTGSITASGALTNLGVGTMAYSVSGPRALTIQNGGGPSGGNDGDVFFIY